MVSGRKVKVGNTLIVKTNPNQHPWLLGAKGVSAGLFLQHFAISFHPGTAGRKQLMKGLNETA